MFHLQFCKYISIEQYRIKARYNDTTYFHLNFKGEHQKVKLIACIELINLHHVQVDKFMFKYSKCFCHASAKPLSTFGRFS